MSPGPMIRPDGYAKITDMQPEQTPDQPIHWDNDRTSMNITLVLAMGIAVYGLVVAQFLMGLAGLAIAAYTWLTRPRRYLIYSTYLVIQYGMPRIKVIPFSEISHPEMLSLPIGDRLRLVLLNGRRMMITARDLDTFREKLDAALEAFHGTDSGGQAQRPTGGGRIIDQAPGPQGPESSQTQVNGAYDQPADTTSDPETKPDFEGPRP